MHPYFSFKCFVSASLVKFCRLSVFLSLPVLQHTVCTPGVLRRQDGKFHAVQFLAPADSNLSPTHTHTHTQTKSVCSPVFSINVHLLQCWPTVPAEVVSTRPGCSHTVPAAAFSTAPKPFARISQGRSFVIMAAVLFASFSTSAELAE